MHLGAKPSGPPNGLCAAEEAPQKGPFGSAAQKIYLGRIKLVHGRSGPSPGVCAPSVFLVPDIWTAAPVTRDVGSLAQCLSFGWRWNKHNLQKGKPLAECRGESFLETPGRNEDADSRSSKVAGPETKRSSLTRRRVGPEVALREAGASSPELPVPGWGASDCPKALKDERQDRLSQPVDADSC